MILESLVTTVSTEGTLNVAPMGPIVDPELTSFVLRPFFPSTTLENLDQTGRAVIHVSDDVTMFARAVMGTLEPSPKVVPLRNKDFWVLENCCRYFAVRVSNWKEDESRPVITCDVVEQGEFRPFFGFNRGKHAVIEAAILATRTHLIPQEELRPQFERLQPLVDKTASEEDSQAFQELKAFALK